METWNKLGQNAQDFPAEPQKFWKLNEIKTDNKIVFSDLDLLLKVIN